MKKVLLALLLILPQLASAQTKIEFNIPFNDEIQLQEAFNKVALEVKQGQADMSTKYSTSMGMRSLWITVNYFQDSKAEEFINFYRSNNMKFFIMVNDKVLGNAP